MRHDAGTVCLVVFAMRYFLYLLLLISATLRADDPPPVLNSTPTLSIAIYLDEGLSESYGDDAHAATAVAALVGDADAIFTAQFGIHVIATKLVLHAPTQDYTQAIVLLNEFDSYDRGSANTLMLLTRRSLWQGAQPISGMSFQIPLCAGSPASIVQITDNAFVDALVFKHELAHAIGVMHDGEGICASTPSDKYIMAPAAAWGATNFSQCSVDWVKTEMTANSSCLMPHKPAIEVIPAAIPFQEYDGTGSLDGTALFVLGIFTLYMWWTGRLK